MCSVGMGGTAAPADSVWVPGNSGVQPQVGIEIAHIIVLQIHVAAITEEAVGFHQVDHCIVVHIDVVVASRRPLGKAWLSPGTHCHKCCWRLYAPAQGLKDDSPGTIAERGAEAGRMKEDR
jgi:hypothetical protein